MTTQRRDTVLPAVILVWALGYGTLRAWWAAGHAPRFHPLGSDLLVLFGWQPVAACGVAALVALALYALPDRWPPVVAAFLVAGVIAASCPLSLLDVVGAVLVGLGLPVDPVGALSRAGYLALAAALALAAVRRSRRLRSACPRCGRGPAWAPSVGVPWWGRAAAYLVVVGCLARFGAQVVAGRARFGGLPFTGGPANVAFDVGFFLAGTVLPLATVQRWGRVFPRWTAPLAGRRVPRWLVLGPAAFLGLGLSVYFGVSLGQLITDPAGWTNGLGYPLVFFWVAIPSYVVWGLGLCVGAAAYRRATRPYCRRCDRPASARPVGGIVMARTGFESLR